MIGIYKIISPKKRVYIGQSVDIEKRFNRYKNLNCKNQPRLLSSLKKYSIDNHKFSVLLECEIEQLNELERYYQELYNVLSKNGLNCMLTKANSRSGSHSEETKRKIGLGNKGKTPSDETKNKISESLKENKNRLGLKHSNETKRKMSLAQKGHKRNLGKKASDETKLKLSEVLKGHKRNLGKKRKPFSDEHKRKMSEAQKLYHANKKLLIN